MKKNKIKNKKKQEVRKLTRLYRRYKNLKDAADFVPRKHLPPLTLDEQLENINPYYVRSEDIKYG